MVNLKKKNFYKKNIKIRLIFSQLNQDFPFSMYEIHSNRYLRGIGEIELFFNFEDPVFVTLSKFEIKSSNLTSLSNEEIILVKDKIIGNAEDGYTRFAAKIQPTSNPILLTYSKYWNQEI